MSSVGFLTKIPTCIIYTRDMMSKIYTQYVCVYERCKWYSNDWRLNLVKSRCCCLLCVGEISLLVVLLLFTLGSSRAGAFRMYPNQLPLRTRQKTTSRLLNYFENKNTKHTHTHTSDIRAYLQVTERLYFPNQLIQILICYDNTFRENLYVLKQL